jgi:peptidoglycan hydrolase-like protein with peptidoglycan-binding domain
MSDALIVQQLLNKTGANLTEDGSLGPASVSAIKQFQLSHHLLPDGRVSSELIQSLKDEVESNEPVSFYPMLGIF